MKSLCAVLVLSAPILSSSALRQSVLTVANLRAEYMRNPIGIDVRNPRLSWELRADRRGVAQAA